MAKDYKYVYWIDDYGYRNSHIRCDKDETCAMSGWSNNLFLQLIFFPSAQQLTSNVLNEAIWENNCKHNKPLEEYLMEDGVI